MMKLVQAVEEDLAALCGLYRSVIPVLAENCGGTQLWRWGAYPSEEMLRQDIAGGNQFVLRDDDGTLLGTICAGENEVPGLETHPWLFGVHPGYLHRMAVAPAHQRHGYAIRLLSGAMEVLRMRGCDSVRWDVYAGNQRAAAIYQQLPGVRQAGASQAPEWPLPFLTFEKALTEDCPLLPLPMRPAFRCGPLTPWGGEKLIREYGKAFPETPAGESLEISCIPGLESTDAAGVPLPELIRRYGSAFAGRYADQPFPLLLKLINAKSPLSVQVHPDDAYAAEHEHGKSGKTEAWLILDAEEGSEIVWGVQPGTDRSGLRSAAEAGPALSALLRRVAVRPGDICYIPAGCVHAILSNVTLYEIQQSSDITYRFYDWDRVDAQGKRRPLHLKQALEVADLSFRSEPEHAPDAPFSQVLNKPCFLLDILRPGGAQPSVALPAIPDFGLLTALTGQLTLVWEGGARPLAKGSTCFIPASSPACALHGSGTAALALPG